MMTRQSVRLPILTIERVAPFSPFFCVSLGLREADRPYILPRHRSGGDTK